MNRRQRKWATTAVVGTTVGLAILLLFRSIPLAAGTATAVIVGMIVVKHVALAMIVGSPLAALFQSLRPKIRELAPSRNDGGSQRRRLIG
jgi:ABC-type Fe3+ transport system permease subunit